MEYSALQSLYWRVQLNRWSRGKVSVGKLCLSRPPAEEVKRQGDKMWEYEQNEAKIIYWLAFVAQALHWTHL